MRVCHAQGVVHRDLKLENVMFETQERTRIKVVDFGIAGLSRAGTAELNESATTRYMTPEMILRGVTSRAHPSMDVWAMGIMLYCMLFHRMPFTGDSTAEIKKAITTTDLHLPRSRPISLPCHQLLISCLSKDPETRITVEQMLDHEWITMEDEQLEELCLVVK